MIIKCPNSFEGNTNKWKVFLAGPIQGAPNWQNTLPELDNVIWISPRRDDAVLNDETHKQQMEWETRALRTANIILFWIPEEVEHVEGRGYAQTTRFELGENLGRGKRIIIGTHDNFPGRLYFEYKANKYDNVINHRVYNTLEDCVNALKNYIKMCEEAPLTYQKFNSDFDEERYSMVEKIMSGKDKASYDPFDFRESADWKKIEQWNTQVNPCDTVYHFGKFGYEWPLNYLTGKIKRYYSRELK